jgi:hypothetical protein
VSRFVAGVFAALVLLVATSCEGPGHPTPGTSTRGGSTPSAPGGPRRPAIGSTWQWQLSGPLDLTVPARVYDVDGDETSVAQVADLHRAGRYVICYVDAGTYEDFRADAGRYPAALLGRGNGWPGERWLDLRRWQVLEPILALWMKMCRDKGFDGVEPDNVDGYENDTGFPLRAEDQLSFNRHVAGLAHAAGLAVGLKNDVGQAAVLEPDFDFAVDEQCAEYHECDELSVFIRAGKPVFEAEYGLPTVRFCDASRALRFSATLRFSAIRKRLDLDAWREPC